MTEEGKGVVGTAIHWGETLLVLLVAAFFGVLRYLQQFQNEPRPKFEWLVLSIKGLTALAIGFLVALIGRKMQIDVEWIAVGGALGGWAGAEIINDAKEVLRDWIRRKAAEGERQPPKG